MDVLKKESNLLKKSISLISDDKVLGQVTGILLILFTVLIAHKLPSSITSIAHNLYFRIFFVIIILLLVKKHLAISLILVIIFFIINSVPVKNNNECESNEHNIVQSTTVNPQVTQTMQPQVCQSMQPQVNQTMQPQVNQTMQPQITQTIEPQVTQTMQPQVTQTMQPQVTQTIEPQVTQTMQPQVTQTIEPQVTQTIQPDITLPPFIPQITQAPFLQQSTQPVPNITLASASENALSESMRSETIKGSAIPLNKEMTPTTTTTVILTEPIANEITSKIKENFSDYMNNTLLNEQHMRSNAKLSNVEPSISTELENSADKLALARKTVSCIINNENVSINESLLKNLVKCDLLNKASDKALDSGDTLSAHQLKQISQSHLNVVNGFVQSDIIKTKALEAKEKGLFNESTKLSKIADTHLSASLNMKNYNDHMEAALNAFTHSDYELSKKHEIEAKSFLKNNLTLNDTIKGIPVKSSEKLYEQVNYYPINSNSLSYNSCDNIPAVNISGWDDYSPAKF
jgi:hypothetical protein